MIMPDIYASEDAEKIKLSQGIIAGISSTPVSYYITDDKN